MEFYRRTKPHWTLKEIATIIGLELSPSFHDIKIYDVRNLNEARDGDLTFFTNTKYLNMLKNTKATACIVHQDFNESQLPSSVIPLKLNNPHYAYAELIDQFYTEIIADQPSIAKTAIISEDAEIGERCYIGDYVVIESGVRIGADSKIEASCFIGYNSQIGERAKIGHHVSIQKSIIGDDFVALAGARIGQDGFGFATKGGKHKKIKHIGRVIIGNDVEVGANTTIDRGSSGDTIIGNGCRIDNLVQIAHNVTIGDGTIVVAQVGIAGSTSIGKYCALGGQVGIAGHLKIEDYVQIAGQGGVIQNITEKGVFGGTPAVPIRDWHKQSVFLRNMIKKT